MSVCDGTFGLSPARAVMNPHGPTIGLVCQQRMIDLIVFSSLHTQSRHVLPGR